MRKIQARTCLSQTSVAGLFFPKQTDAGVAMKSIASHNETGSVRVTILKNHADSVVISLLQVNNLLLPMYFNATIQSRRRE